MKAGIQEVADHYEKYPYPSYPLFASGRWRDLQRVDLREWGVKNPNPKLWIVGCGTIAPLMFGRRNPAARIIASELSRRSLQIARARCLIYGIKNIHFRCEDFLEVEQGASYDAIDAYGVVHHTPDPEKSIRHLLRHLLPGGVLRLMIYSSEAREALESERQKWQGTNIDAKALRKNLPQNFLNQFSELKTTSGIADALLHPLVHTYSKSELDALLSRFSGFELSRLNSSGNYIIHLRKI